MDRKAIVARWTAEAKKHLVGRRIREVRYLTPEEVKALGWHSSTLVIQLDNGAIFYASADDEGNDAGALFGQGPNGEEITIPVIA